MTASTLNAWTSCQTICLTHHRASLSGRLQCDGPQICILKFLHFFCDLWRSDHLSELENGYIGLKEIHWRFSTRISPEMLLLVIACLHQPAGSSHLPHITTGSHRPGGSHISAGPQISVGSHRPWGSHHKPWGSHPHHQKFHPIQHEPSHPGYQTNIVIDPYAKVSIRLGAQLRTWSLFIITFPNP